MKYKVGQKIYNRGDMANQPGWFVITKVNEGWKSYDLKEIDGEREINHLYECGISEVDEGHCGTRFVTEQAYKAYMEQQLAYLTRRAY